MVSDLSARQAALDPEASFIVQAPAGSGKTGLLVYRMLTLLARVEKPQQVLSITFTRKATSEMRERLVELLEYADADHQSSDAFEQQGIDLARAVLVQDRQHQWRLLDAPHQLQILTIDAFCAKLTGSMPWLSRLGDRPRTADNASAHYAAAIEQLFNELLEPDSILVPALKTVLLELDFNYNKARDLFASMLAKRDQWLRHLLQNNISSMQASLEQAWQEVSESHLEQLNQLLPDATIDQLASMACYAISNLESTHKAAPPLEPFRTFEAGESLTVTHWRGLCTLLLTGDKFRKQVNKNNGFIAKSKETLRFKEMLAEFADDTVLLDAINETKLLPDAHFDSADWQQLVALEQVLKALAALLQLRFRATGECDHSEVTQRANLALQELENPTDLGLRMDYHLQHILVDEFQDTSHGQIELLKKLTSGWADADERKTLFLVGDPMQSIYRFREADVSLFLQVADNANTQVFSGLDIQPLRLTENFRSSKSLVNWFNQTFQPSFPQQNNIMSGAISYAQASCGKSDDYQACQYLLAYDRDQEAELLVAAVESALLELQEKDQIAILVRTRPQLEYLLPKLQVAGIEYAGIDIQPLAELQAVVDVLALCKALCREDDRIAWLALLRGPWCGLSLVDIKHIAGDKSKTVWSQLLSANLSGLDSDAQIRVSKFIAQMKDSMAQRQQVPLASLARWTWQGLGGPEVLLGASISDIETVFSLVQGLERGGDLPSMRELDKALDGLFAQATLSKEGQTPKVVVSTMHKSKGLQYHTVILPGLSNTPRHDDKEVMMWAEVPSKRGDSNLLIAPFTQQSQQGQHYEYLRHLESNRSGSETVRLMYVAATRAEKKLVLLARAKYNKDGEVAAPQKKTLLNTVWQTLENRFQFPLEEPQERPEDDQLPQTLCRLPSSFSPSFVDPVKWQVTQQLNNAPKLPDDGAQIEYEWATPVATGIGIVLHDWLQYNSSSVLTIEPDQALIHRWRSELLNLRVPYNMLEYGVQRLKEAVTNIQAFSEAHFLFNDYAIAENEYTVSVYESGSVNKYRIDRTFVDEAGVRWIVDYKSTPHDQGDVAQFVTEQVETRHKAQLEKYGALLSQLDTRPIQLAVYFPLLKQLVAWPYQP